MKCLFLKEGCLTGGTTSSFLNLLSALDQSAGQFDVWIRKDAETDIELPGFINRVSIPELDDAFCMGETRLKRLFYYIRNGMILERILSRFRSKNRNALIHNVQKFSLRRLRRVKRINLREYDVVIAWEEFFPCYLLAEKIDANRKIAWIHPDYIQCGFDKTLDQPLFDKLERIVAVSKAGCESLKQTFPEMADKFRAVRNNLNIEAIRLSAVKRPTDMPIDNCPTFVTVARMQNVSKAIDRAIRVAQRLVKEKKTFKWYFVGDGENFDEMRSLADRKGLNEFMVFLGYRNNPYGYIRYADLFILQSYYEGCPVTVDESLVLGTPVLVSDYKSAREQVDPRYGIVVDNDEEKIYSALNNILDHPELLLSYRENLKGLDTAVYRSSKEFDLMLKELKP